MASLPPDLDIKETEAFDKKRLDRAFAWLHASIVSLQSFQPKWIAAINELREFGLARINEAIAPAYERVMNLAKFGFLKADSQTAATLVLGETRTFTISDEVQRSLFTPTEFVALTRISAFGDWAVARVLNYNATTGLLVVLIEAVSGNIAEYDDWQVTATAGTTVAAVALLADTRAARDSALAIKNETAAIRLSAIQDVSAIQNAAQVARLAAEKAANDANAAALLIEGGPVASINGETGNVILTQNSIPNLVGDLASKADKQTTLTALSDRYTKAATDAMLNAVAVAVADALDKKHDIGDPVLDMGGTVLSAQPGGVAVEHAGGTQSATFHYDGNIHGSVWGGYLSNWIAAQIEALRQWAYASFMTDIRLTGWWEGGVGQYCWNHEGGGGTVLTSIHTGGPTASGASITNRGGRYLQKQVGGNWYTVGTY